MPPKKAKLHELAVEVPSGTSFADASRKLEFVIGNQFASGGFGRIYTCKQKGATGELVVKVEPFGNGPLFTEISVFNRILKKEMLDTYLKQNKKNRIGLPWIVAAGYFEHKGEKLRYMVMPKYETSLEAIREKKGGRLAVNDTWHVAGAVLDSLQYMHKHNYVHADIKAGNILLEKASDPKTAVLVDFGLARMSASNVDKPDKKRAHNGTALFTSMDAHRGNNPSFRGDIEILAYNVLYWLTGSVPWKNLEASPDKVFVAKQDFTKNVGASIEKEIKGPSASALAELFDLALCTGYVDHIDFGNARKIIDKALSSSNKITSEKTPSKGRKVVVPVSSPVSSPEQPPVKPVQRRRKAVIKEEPKNVAVEDPISEAKERKPRAKRLNGICPGRTTRATRISRKRTSEEITGEDSSSTKDDTQQKENETSDEDKKKSKPISPETKMDPARLRQMVPGMRNLPKGRRSMLVNQITKKYQRMAKNNTKKDL